MNNVCLKFDAKYFYICYYAKFRKYDDKICVVDAYLF